MNKIILGVNALLVIAVGYLLYKVNSTGPEKNQVLPAEAPIASAFADTANIKAPVLAYVNGDTLNERYLFIVEKTRQLEAGLKQADKKVRDEYNKRQQEANELMQYAQSKGGNLPDDEAQTIQGRLAQLEQEMAEIEERETGQVMKKEEELQRELQKRVNKFLDRYARERGIDFVINYQESVQLVLYGNRAYDVTAEVLAGLNAEYEQEKAAQ